MIERYSEFFFRGIIRFPSLILGAVFLLTLFIAIQVNSIRIDGTSENLLDRDNPAFQTYMQFKEDYQAGLSIILLIEDEAIFSLPFLENLQVLQSDLLDSVPYIERVESLLSSRRVLAVGEDLYFDSLIPDQLNSRNIAEAKQVALNTPYYLNHIINSDANATAVLIKMQPFIYSAARNTSRPILQKEMHEIIASIDAVIAKNAANFGGKISVGGPTVATIEMMAATKQDVTLLTLLALLVIAVVLALVFRRLSAVFLPLFLLSFSITITMSLMLIANVPIQNVSAILPSFL